MGRPGSRRYRLLDHWRGLACLSVLFFHASGQQPDHGTLAQELVARLWIGVPIFFVISGYCITASVIRTRDTGGTLGDYFKRRVRRIFPPYWTAMLLVAVLSGISVMVIGTSVLAHMRDGFDAIDASSLTSWRWLGTVTLTEGWRGHLLPFGGHGWYLGHAWTLGYEEQFYAVAGLILLVAPRRWFAVAGAVTLAVVATAALVPHDIIGGFWFNGRWITFACGIGVYYYLHETETPWRHLVPLGMLAALAWAITRSEFGANGMVTETAVGAATALALIPLYRYDTAWADLAALRPLQWCGIRCYSLYLLHWPIAKAVWWGLTTEGIDGWPRTPLVAVPITLAVSVAATALFFRFVEKPCLSPASRRAAADVAVEAPAPGRPVPA